MKDWRKRCTKHGKPLLPGGAEQALAWLRGKVRKAIGFTTFLERESTAVYVRQDGKMIRGWQINPRP